MSRIGRKPIPVPAGVSVTAEGRRLTVKGPKGELTYEHRPEVTVAVGEREIRVETDGQDRPSRAYHGMTRALLQNMVTGVSTGFERKLEINGVGYTASLSGKDLVLNLGFSHPIRVPIPDTISVEVPSPTAVTVRGCDKQQVGETAARIRKLRPPEPYKGKGVKYDDEIVHRKAGKAFGSA